MKILIVRLGALGDVLNVFPAARGLKEAAPEAELSWLVEETAASLVRANPDVAETFVMPRRRWQAALFRPGKALPLPAEVARFVGEIKRRRFDVALDFQGNLKSGVLGRLVGVPRRIGFSPPHCRELNQIFTTERVTLPDRPVHRALKNLVLVRAVAPNARCAPPRLVCPQEDVAFAESFAAADTRRLVGIHPGTSDFGKFKRWPTTRYAEVARRIARELGARPVITWGPGESALAREVVEMSRGAAELAPQMSLTQLAEVIRRMALFIASDTGPLHLAAILGRPVVAIFGPKDPAVYGPFGCPCIVVRRDLDCMPCAKRRCSKVDCIMKIEPREVFDAAATMLASERMEGT